MQNVPALNCLRSRIARAGVAVVAGGAAVNQIRTVLWSRAVRFPSVARSGQEVNDIPGLWQGRIA